MRHTVAQIRVFGGFFFGWICSTSTSSATADEGGGAPVRGPLVLKIKPRPTQRRASKLGHARPDVEIYLEQAAN